MEIGARIVQAARGWIGTPFHHQGRMKCSVGNKGGVDCLGLLIGIAQELKLASRQEDSRLLTDFDVRDYGHIPDGEHLSQVLSQLLFDVTQDSRMPGDVLLLRFERAPQHLAILSDHPQGGFGLVHALASARKVVEQRYDANWQKRLVQAFRIKGD